MNNKRYLKLSQSMSKNSNVLKDCTFAFLVGGVICTLGQALTDLYWQVFEMPMNSAKALTSITLITLSIILTGLNIYPKIAKFAGAGTLVPITGFANACASAAIEFKTEGKVLGTGANIFKISGPVIVFGLLAGWIYGVICYVFTLI